MSEPYRTMAEIEATYPNEWVLIDRPKVDRREQMLGGHVVFHSEDRDAMEQATNEASLSRHIARRVEIAGLGARSSQLGTPAASTLRCDARLR